MRIDWALDTGHWTLHSGVWTLHLFSSGEDEETTLNYHLEDKGRTIVLRQCQYLYHCTMCSMVSNRHGKARCLLPAYHHYISQPASFPREYNVIPVGFKASINSDYY